MMSLNWQQQANFVAPSLLWVPGKTVGRTGMLTTWQAIFLADYTDIICPNCGNKTSWFGGVDGVMVHEIIKDSAGSTLDAGCSLAFSLFNDKTKVLLKGTDKRITVLPSLHSRQDIKEYLAYLESA